jgi:hypothetical protein
VKGELLPIFFGALLTLLTAWGLGKIMLSALHVRLCRWEEDLFAFLTGSACLSLLVFVLASLHLATRSAFAILCASTGALLYWRNPLKPAREKLPRMPRTWLVLFVAPFAAYTFLYFFNALAPETNPGPSAFHLDNVMRWWTDPTFPSPLQGLDMLFLFAFSFGKHPAAVLFNFAFLLALPWLMLCYGRRFGMVRPLVLAAMLVYLSPAAGILGTTASNDVAVTAVLFGLFYLLELWDASGDNRLLVLAGLLAGFGCAISYVGTSPTIGSPRELSLLWSLQGNSVQGVFGPWLLLTPLAALAVKWKHGRRLLLAGVLFGLLAFTEKASALMLPFAAFVAPALGLAVQNSPGILPLLLVLHSLVSWPGAVNRFADPSAWRISKIPVMEALRVVPEDAQLQAAVEGYGVARTIEQVTPARSRILTLCPVPQAYTTRLLFHPSESAIGKLAYQAITAVSESVVHPLAEMRFRFSPQSLRALRIVPTAKTSNVWSVTEMRVYLAGVEIPRSQAWRVSARPNSPEAPLAFDNSEVTAWSTGQNAQPGMFLEENFGSAVRVDQSMLLSRGDAKLRIDGLASDGQWRILAGSSGISLHSPPDGLRRIAVEELKSLGLEYVVTRNDETLGQDMLRYASYWGMKCFKQTGNVCIFRLD